MKILVAIASHGTGNDPYLKRVIDEYRGMAHEVDIVLTSNISKAVPAGVELVVGMPTSDPWSLTFAHRRVIVERADKYDLYIYSENDILISQTNIEAFLHATSLLPENEIAGFLRTERAPNGDRYYPDVNKMYHWDPESVVQRGGQTFAFFSCEHAGCYMLTREQLRRAIDSGGYLVEPHEGRYDMACTAATDPYTQCGFKKMICITDLEKFLLPHLSNKYVGTEYDLHETDFDVQIRAMLDIWRGSRSSLQLLKPENIDRVHKWSKHYYEAKRPEILQCVPHGTNSVLSVGCGWGALEEDLVAEGIEVVGIPLDAIISACTEARGVETVSPDFTRAWNQLAGRSFDCVMVSNILHLVADPLAIVRECARVLSPGGTLIVATPNFQYLKTIWRRIRRIPGYRSLSNYGQSGVNLTSHRLIEKWFECFSLKQDRVINIFPKRSQAISDLRELFSQYLASDLIMIGRQQASGEIPPRSEANRLAEDQRRSTAQLATHATR